MFIHPLIALEKGWIKGVRDPKKQVQPNAIDFTLDQLGSIPYGDDEIPFIGESRKKMRTIVPMTAVYQNSQDLNPHWLLNGKSVYDGLSDVYVEVPEGVAAVLWTRSTFARNGVFIMSGLYDTGFKGNVGFTIYTIGGQIEIEKGTRIGQIGFIAAANAGVYKGGYNTEAGKHWAESSLKATAKPQVFNIEPAQQTPQIESQVDPLVGGSAQSTLAKELQTTSGWNSDQIGPPAGTKTFV